ncbi:Succinate-semialdehyde dehydrogenase [NADP(+)] 1 [Serratia fonticola]|uniref:Succinate-semialdehyde dehydrogenase [NADP(+)] 1 n=1 Tax=Serratia fonticola TaxID=47917 RepID=A0A4U9W218_SERFO|nr:Succinate-semialdehyde dehydrogenase [NADP(+)] 1 [Serratia fonticola]
MGKLIEQSRGEVKLCGQIARYYANNAQKFLAPVSYESSLGEAWVEHHPIGVLMAVEPWNFPFYQLMRVLAPNLAAGNPVVVKHASIVPHCAEAFEKLVHEAGAPKGPIPTCIFPGSGGQHHRRRSGARCGADRF